MKKALVTGANGFIGGHLCNHLAKCGWEVHAAVRSGSAHRELEPHTRVHYVADVAGSTEWVDLLRDVEVVIHLAARVHVMHDTAVNALEEYRRVNTVNTAKLARVAARQGVTRFVFLSSIKVNGELTLSKPFSENDAPMPSDPYSVSKWEAEQQLAEIASGTSMITIALRPPLVYGPGVKGNFLRLMKLVGYRVPLPLAGADNSRSLLYVGNLASAIEQILTAPVSTMETFVVSDDHDISTPQLIKTIAAAMNVKTRLFRCPPPLLIGLATIAGKGDEMRRMIESLSIDCTRIKQHLHWTPPYTVEHGIRDTARWFRDMHAHA